MAPVLSISNETHFYTGISDHDLDLIFYLNKDAHPLVVVDDVTLYFNGTVWNNERTSIQLFDSNTIVVSISHLRLLDTGNYTVTVTTAAGMDSSWAYLEVYGWLLEYHL